MAQPALIKRWSDTSLFLLNNQRPTEAFLIAWVSWEAYLERVALVALSRQGLTLADSTQVLRTWRGARRGRRLRDAFARLFGRYPEQLPGTPAKTWKALNGRPVDDHSRHGRTSFKDRRNGLVHGSRSLAPRHAIRGVWLIRDAVIEHELCEAVPVRIAHGEHAGQDQPLGRVVRPLRPRADPSVSVEDVLTWLEGGGS